MPKFSLREKWKSAEARWNSVNKVKFGIATGLAAYVTFYSGLLAYGAIWPQQGTNIICGRNGNEYTFRDSYSTLLPEPVTVTIPDSLDAPSEIQRGILAQSEEENFKLWYEINPETGECDVEKETEDRVPRGMF